MASTVDKLYEQFRHCTGEGRFTYKNNKLAQTPAGVTVYAFPYRVSNFSRSLNLGEVLPLKILPVHNRVEAFRLKKDGTSFKKSVNIWDYCIYATKEEAESAHQRVAKFFIERLAEEENKLCALRTAFMRHLK